MDYKFKYNPQAYDLWRLSIYGIFSTMAGMVNTIFIVSMVILTMKFWSVSSIFIRLLLLLGLSLFTIIQPLTIYGRSKKQVDALPEDMYLGFNKSGIHIEMPTARSHVKWKDVTGVKTMRKMLIVYTSENQGYVLTDNILGSEKQDFLEYLRKKLKK